MSREEGRRSELFRGKAIDAGERGQEEPLLMDDEHREREQQMQVEEDAGSSWTRLHIRERMTRSRKIDRGRTRQERRDRGRLIEALGLELVEMRRKDLGLESRITQAWLRRVQGRSPLARRNGWLDPTAADQGQPLVSFRAELATHVEVEGSSPTCGAASTPRDGRG